MSQTRTLNPHGTCPTITSHVRPSPQHDAPTVRQTKSHPRTLSAPAYSPSTRRPYMRPHPTNISQKNDTHHSTDCRQTFPQLEEGVVCGVLLPRGALTQGKCNTPVPSTHLTRVYTHVLSTSQNGAPQKRTSHWTNTRVQAPAKISHARMQPTLACTIPRHQQVRLQ